jgi:hypothetical protein
MPWTIADVDSHKRGLDDQGKRQWVAVANSVLKKCLADGGTDATCAPAAIRQANGVAGNKSGTLGHYGLKAQSYTIREEMHQGRKHLVVPVIMMVEGVHAGSHGPLLHLADEMGRFPGAWDGIPISVQHPVMDGYNVSCNSPDVINEQAVGRVYHTQMDGGRLRAEAYIDLEAITRISPEALRYIRQGLPLDVSVGVFTDDEQVTGDWMGEAYQAIARGHRPDHLALLPGGTGACSWADGCGVRINEKGGDDVTKKPVYTSLDDVMAAVLPPELLKELAGHGFGITVNQLSYGEISQKIQAKLDRMDDDTKVHYLEETYPGFFIYRVRPRGGRDMPMNPDGEALFKRNYTSQGDGSVEFIGEAQPVVKQVQYINANQKEVATMAKEKEGTACCPEKVDALIANTETKWTADDREILLTMSAEQLEKLTPVEVKPKPPAPPPVMNKEQAIQVLQEHLGDPEKFLALLPAKTRASVEHGMKLHEAHRAGIIAKITAASPDVYTADEFAAMSIETLDKLARIAKVPTDFTPLGGGHSNMAAYEGEELLPPGVA